MDKPMSYERLEAVEGWPGGCDRDVKDELCRAIRRLWKRNDDMRVESLENILSNLSREEQCRKTIEFHRRQQERCQARLKELLEENEAVM